MSQELTDAERAAFLRGWAETIDRQFASEDEAAIMRSIANRLERRGVEGLSLKGFGVRYEEDGKLELSDFVSTSPELAEMHAAECRTSGWPVAEVVPVTVSADPAKG